MISIPSGVDSLNLQNVINNFKLLVNTVYVKCKLVNEHKYLFCCIFLFYHLKRSAFHKNNCG